MTESDVGMRPNERSEVYSVAYGRAHWRRSIGVTASGLSTFVFGNVGADGFKLFIGRSELD
jgi:hypothetical protein